MCVERSSLGSQQPSITLETESLMSALQQLSIPSDKYRLLPWRSRCIGYSNVSLSPAKIAGVAQRILNGGNDENA